MSELLHFSEHTLQELALGIMAVVYTLRLIWLFRYKAGGDRQAPTGPADATPRRGIIYSWLVIAKPWAMESTRTKLFFYAQFVVFHLGVVSAIGLSFIIPYGPRLLEWQPLVVLLRVSIGLACLVGCYRIVRRVTDPYMRAISTPDDYFSLILLTVWFFFAFVSVPNRLDQGEWHLITYFIMTAFFLIYVPFSKISHYLYYPITRYYFGKTMGHRGGYPLRGTAKPKTARG